MTDTPLPPIAVSSDLAESRYSSRSSGQPKGRMHNATRLHAKSPGLSRDDRKILASSPVPRNTAHAPHDPVGCRYITGDPRKGEWHYCNHKQASGSSYCAAHHPRCYDGLRRERDPGAQPFTAGRPKPSAIGLRP